MMEARKRARALDPKDERKQMEMQRTAHQSAQHGAPDRVHAALDAPCSRSVLVHKAPLRNATPVACCGVAFAALNPDASRSLPCHALSPRSFAAPCAAMRARSFGCSRRRGSRPALTHVALGFGFGCACAQPVGAHALASVWVPCVHAARWQH